MNWSMNLSPNNLKPGIWFTRTLSADNEWPVQYTSLSKTPCSLSKSITEMLKYFPNKKSLAHSLPEHLYENQYICSTLWEVAMWPIQTHLSMLGWEVFWKHGTTEQRHWIIVTVEEGQVLWWYEISWEAASTFPCLPIKVLIDTATWLYSLQMQ